MPRYDPDDLGARVYKAIAGRSINTEPDDFGSALRWFMRKGGNPSAAARLAGVPRRTMRDWLEGKGLGPRSAARRGQLVESARLSERRARLGPRKEARLRGGGDVDTEIVVHGSYNYDQAGGDRPGIVISDWMPDDAADQLVDAYLNGDGPDELRTLFASMIEDPFYGDTMGLPTHDPHGWSVSNLTM